MTAYEIPLSPQNQQFTIALGGNTYQMTVRWNSVCGSWILDIADPPTTTSQAGAPILSGIPMVTGIDLLEQFGYLRNWGGGNLSARRTTTRTRLRLLRTWVSHRTFTGSRMIDRPQQP